MQKANSVILVIFTCVLIGFAVVVKPTGELHSSILAITGELLSAALAFAGLYNWRNKNGKE